MAPSMKKNVGKNKPIQTDLKVLKTKVSTDKEDEIVQAEMETFSASLDKSQVEVAVSALLKGGTSTKKHDLLLTAGEAEPVFLSIALNKIPEATKRLETQRIAVKLPHSLCTPTTTIALFVGDSKRKLQREYDDTVDEFKADLKQQNVTHDIEIIPLKQLHNEFQEFEARRRLVNMYDIFLADARVYSMLHKLIGHQFHDKNKFPKAVKLHKKKFIRKEINKAVDNGQLVIGGHGNNCTLQVAHTNHSASQIAENIMATFTRLCETLPGGAQNIMSVDLKTQKSVAIPLYYNRVPSSSIVLPKKVEEEEIVDPEDVTTIEGGKVKVFKHGTIKLVEEREISTSDGATKAVTRETILVPGSKKDALAMRRQGQKRQNTNYSTEDGPKQKGKRGNSDEAESEFPADLTRAQKRKEKKKKVSLQKKLAANEEMTEKTKKVEVTSPTPVTVEKTNAKLQKKIAEKTSKTKKSLVKKSVKSKKPLVKANV